MTFPANQDAMISEVRAAFAAGKVPEKRDVEAILRDSGLSRKAAQALLANGYAGLLSLRDADDAASNDVTAELRHLSTLIKGH